MRKMIGMVVGLATLAGIVGVPNAFGLVQYTCEHLTQSGTTRVRLVVALSNEGPDDSVAGSCSYVSSNGLPYAQTYDAETPNTFTISVNNVVVVRHNDIAEPGGSPIAHGSFTAPVGAVVTVSLLNGCPQPGKCGASGTVAAGGLDPAAPLGF
jgi:hypothetical protein